MKKTLLIAAAALCMTSAGYAQKSNVRGAKMKALSVDKPNYTEAKSLIEDAIVHEDTKDQAKTLWTAGLVYEKSAENLYKLQRLNKPVEKGSIGKDAAKAYEYYLLAYDLDNQPNKKGKIKPKFSKKISKSFIMMYQYMFLSNYAIEFYQDEDYTNAYKYFGMHTDILDLPMVAGAKDVPAKDSTYYEIKYYQGVSAYYAQDMDNALKVFNDIKDSYKDGNKIYRMIFQIYKDTEDKENQIATLNAALDKYPGEFVFLASLIDFYVSNNEFEKADQFIDKAIQTQPDNVKLYVLKGIMFQNLEDYDNALTFYNKALEMDNQDPENYMNVGRMYYFKAQEMETAASSLQMDAYKKAMKDASDTFKQSLPFFEKAVELDNTNVKNIKSLRSLYFRFSSESKEYETKYNEMSELLNKSYE